MDEWKYFTLEELTCRCGCGQCDMDLAFMARLEEAREVSCVPYHIRSGYRCEAHDQAVGGKGNHHGHAVDIGFDSGLTGYKILEGLIAAGFTRIGIDFRRKFIHADNMRGRPDPCIWSY